MLKVCLTSFGRIILKPLIIIILGTVAAIILQVVFGMTMDPFITILIVLAYGVTVIVSFVLLIINQLRYVLAPFVYLALGIAWRPVLAAFRSYYQTHRLVVLILFGFVILVNLAVLFLFIYALPNLGVSMELANIVSVVIQSIVNFFMVGVLINFGMNNFIPGNPVIEEK